MEIALFVGGTPTRRIITFFRERDLDEGYISWAPHISFFFESDGQKIRSTLLSSHDIKLKSLWIGFSPKCRLGLTSWCMYVACKIHSTWNSLSRSLCVCVRARFSPNFHASHRTKSWTSTKATLQPNAIVRKRSKHTVWNSFICIASAIQYSVIFYFHESCHAHTHSHTRICFTDIYGNPMKGKTKPALQNIRIAYGIELFPLFIWTDS